MRDLLAIVVPVALGFGAIYWLLPRPHRYRPLLGALLGAAALLLAGMFLTTQVGVVVETLLFYTFAAIAVGSGGLLVTQRNPVYAALAFALVVLSTCGLFLLQAAPFLMAATIIIYAGAIIVTFLFVIMLAQQAGLSDADSRSREPLLSSLAGFVLLGALLFVLHQAYQGKLGPLNAPPLVADDLAALVGRIADAEAKATVQEIAEALGDEDFFREFQRKVEGARPSPASRGLVGHLKEVEQRWWVWKPAGRAGEMKQALADLRQGVHFVLAEQGRAQLPAENVASLGKMLFSQYLLAVELAGLLLLVAAIGAIAIAGRRAEELR